MPTKKANLATPPTEGKPPMHKDLIPGHGGRLTFVEDGVIIFIPKSFLESWPAIAVKVSKKEDKFTLERHERVEK